LERLEIAKPQVVKEASRMNHHKQRSRDAHERRRRRASGSGATSPVVWRVWLMPVRASEIVGYDAARWSGR
jgi:hypothetical protein